MNHYCKHCDMRVKILDYTTSDIGGRLYSSLKLECKHNYIILAEEWTKILERNERLIARFKRWCGKDECVTGEEGAD